MEIEELWKNIKGELGNLEKRIDARMDEKLFALEGRMDEKMDKKMDTKLNSLEERMDKKMDTKLNSLEGRMNKKFETMEKNAIAREKGIEERAIKREKVMEEKMNQKFETINVNIAKILEEQVRTTQEVREVKRALKENEIENKKLDVRVSNLELKVSGF